MPARHVPTATDRARADGTAVHDVVILGAGMSGLCLGIELKRAGLHDFLVLEQQAGIGGTWWDNRYPGAHVDVPAPLYSFSFEPNPHWRQRFAAAPEIQAYMMHCTDKYGLQPHLRLGVKITAARFDDTEGWWTLDTQGPEGHRQILTRFFVCSTGPLSQVRWPDIPGLDHFQGRKLHSARWDARYRAHGQRVAVIGTGSTASQLIPPLAQQAAQLHVFQRTANWVLPRMDRPYFALERLLARFPPYAWAVRAFWYHLLEWGRRGFDEGTVARRGMLKTAARHLQRQVPDPTLRAKLRPPYPLGCKRIIYSSDFYPALSQPNVELVTEGIERITPTGIVTADGHERPIDTLVCATGFDTTRLLASVDIQGLGGQRLATAWRDGAQAWQGVAVTGFPNLFLMLGPNTGTGHTSTLLYIEPQAQHIVACIRHVLQGGHRGIAVRPRVQAAYNAALQARLAGSVWSTCRSWYRDDSGRIVALWPGFTQEYVKGLTAPDFAAYEMLPGVRPQASQQTSPEASPSAGTDRQSR